MCKNTTTPTRRNTGTRRCRFDYPQNACPTIRLKTHGDVGNRSRFYLIKHEAEAEMINPYNPQLLLVWQANMDIQMVVSVFGAAMYVSHYICKDASQALKKVIADNLARLPEDASVRSRLNKIGNTLLSHRQLSQQEAAFLMTGLHLKGSSRATVFVATVSEERRTRLVKPSSQLRELGDEDTNVFLMGLIDRYTARPEGECFNSMTLAHFAVWYNYTAAPVGDDDHSGNCLPRYELQNGLGTIMQCRQSACL